MASNAQRYNVGGVLLLVFQQEIAEADRSGDGRVVALIYGVTLTAIGFVLFAAFAAAPFLPRKPWVWIYHLVLICIGLSGITFVASLPLLIFWLRPEAKAWFGRRA